MPAAAPWVTLVDSNDLMLIGLLLLAAVSVGAVVYLLVNAVLLGRAAHRQAHPGRDRDQVAPPRRQDPGRHRPEPPPPGRRHPEGAGGPPEDAREGVAAAAPGAGRPRHHPARILDRQHRLRRRVVAACIWLSAPNLPIIVPMLGLFVGGLGLPRWFLARLTKRRQTKFTDEFANAIDVIVRGVKSGLPLPECLGIIARELPEPVADRVHRARRAAARRRAAWARPSSA